MDRGGINENTEKIADTIKETLIDEIMKVLESEVTNGK